MKRFGEMGIVKKGSKIQGKLLNKGEYVMFVGYADKHAPDVYRLLKMSNKKIVMSRDVRWLDKTYNEWLSKTQENEIHTSAAQRENEDDMDLEKESDEES